MPFGCAVGSQSLAVPATGVVDSSCLAFLQDRALKEQELEKKRGAAEIEALMVTPRRQRTPQQELRLSTLAGVASEALFTGVSSVGKRKKKRKKKKLSRSRRRVVTLPGLFLCHHHAVVPAVDVPIPQVLDEIVDVVTVSESFLCISSMLLS